MTQRSVKPQEAKQLMDGEGYVYLDVRSIPEFEQGHPAGAYNAPIAHMTPRGMQPNADFVAVMSRAFPKDAKLVVGCKSGARSLRAIEAMKQAGFTDLVFQAAGWDGATDAFGRTSEPGWRASGLPVATKAEAGRSWAELEKSGG